MPVGVPKVPFGYEDDPYTDWVDLYNRLYRERLLFLCQDLNVELTNQLVGIMVYLNAEDDSQDLFMYINSPGGSLRCGVAVFDVMHFITPIVTTISVGSAASTASLVLTGGTRGHRISLPNCRLMIHQPGGGSRGATGNVLSDVSEMLRLNTAVVELYAERTGQPVDKVRKDMKRDEYMSSKEAKVYGLVDLVAASMY